MTNLEPDVGVRQGTRRISENAIKAGQRFVVFSLLFVYNAQTEKDLICFVKI